MISEGLKDNHSSFRTEIGVSGQRLISPLQRGSASSRAIYRLAAKAGFVAVASIFIFSGFTNHLPDCAFKPDSFFHLTLSELLSEPLIRLIFYSSSLPFFRALPFS